jgi:hypothetical protein
MVSAHKILQVHRTFFAVLRLIPIIYKYFEYQFNEKNGRKKISEYLTIMLGLINVCIRTTVRTKMCVRVVKCRQPLLLHVS